MSERKYQTGVKRFLAIIIDGIVFLPLMIIDRLIYSFQSSNTSLSMLFIWRTFLAFIPLAYSIILHYKYGQTIGKSVVGVKVLDISETRKLSLRQAIFRDLFYLLVIVFGVFYYGFLFAHSETPEYVLDDYSNFSDNPIFWWTLIELVTMLTNNKRRALHDFIAKSVVVRTEINNSNSFAKSLTEVSTEK